MFSIQAHGSILRVILAVIGITQPKALKAGTHGTPGGENILRVTEDGTTVRYFTTREAARLHTFPDTWRFHGTWGDCIKQLGNAIPVELAGRFAERIHRCLALAQQTTTVDGRYDYQTVR